MAREASLLFNYLSSESLINRIERLHGEEFLISEIPKSVTICDSDK